MTVARSVRIGDRDVGTAHPPFVIAEMSGNHNGDLGTAATAFYLANRAAMDAGASVPWPERFEAHEVSAIQHAYHRRYDLGEVAFGCEFQNQPPVEAHDVDPQPLRSFVLLR